MSTDILAIDVGTSGLKLGVFTRNLDLRRVVSRSYSPRLYDGGKADIDPETWWSAIVSCCREIEDDLAGVGVIALSVTTPGLTPMSADGTPLAPAVLFLDGRSHAQAARIREIVGEDEFLRGSANLPVSGGSSLASILWFRDERPDVWDATDVFGHCNTYITRRMTGRWAIDPSTTSITGLYSTSRNDLTWNGAVLEAAGIPERLLPPLMHSHEVVGTILPAVADELRLPPDAVVLCGANDATLAALSGGITEPGDISIISGTCDIVSVCTDEPISSPAFNVRCHVIPNRWLTFFVLNAGGEALEWFRRTACLDMEADAFYGSYLPDALEAFLDCPEIIAREAELPVYDPHLGGSRYSLRRLTGAFTGLTLQTSREDLLVSVVRGNMEYLGGHLGAIAGLLPLGRRVGISGGGARIRGMLAARRRWTGAFEYKFQDQSSMLGAAMLGVMHLDGVESGGRPGPGLRERQPATMRAQRTGNPR
ncbi:MAG TPA: FGGY family carbohydrate kinase [Propionicimonas sp.]|jgi:sugar (pentulose or hexulose) kinase